MKKRILSIVLAICLVLSCIPITVFAADEPGDVYALLSEVLNKGGTQKLQRDYIVTRRTISLGKSVTIDLNGHVILFNGGHFEVGSSNSKNIKLTIKDDLAKNGTKPEHTGQFAGFPNGGVVTSTHGGTCGGCVRVTDTSTFNLEEGAMLYNSYASTEAPGSSNPGDGDGGAVYIDQGGTFNMKGGTIDGCTAVTKGGAVFVEPEGIFDMSGGTIKNCKAQGIKKKELGGAVYIDDGGTFTMSNGTIQNCTAYYGAGGVLNDGTFTMSGGSIDNCSAENAGGVTNTGTFNMTNGTIKNCHATNGGAVVTGSTFTMKGGVIDNCKADNKGGGVTVMSSAKTTGIFTLDGGTIKNCSAVFGGGVANGFDSLYNTYFTMKSGTIDNCQAKKTGGGVHNEDYTVSTISGGTIKNCVAYCGGGVAVSRNASYTSSGKLILENSASNELSKFNMSGGTIENCRAINYNEDGVFSIGCGGGVFVFYGKFTMTDGTIKNCTASDSKCDAIWLFTNADMIADGGSVYGKCFVDDHYFDSISKIKNTDSSKYTKFYDLVENQGTISGGVFYGGIKNTQNKKGVYGNVTSPYKIVTFDSNGGSAVPNQWLVNAKGATAHRPTNPTRENYKFMGWYKDDNLYDFSTAVPENTIGLYTLKAKWVCSNVSTESGLYEAINAGITSIKLIGDIELSKTLTLTNKEITLDLNGYTLTGDVKLSSQNLLLNTSLTLIDSNPTATHTDKTLPLGGVLDGSINLTKTSIGQYSTLYANGGTVTGRVSLSNNFAIIQCTSSTPTAFTGSVDGSGEIHGGIFYDNVNTECIEEAIVVFVNDSKRYALEVVKYGGNAYAPVDPEKEGYVFAGWYNGSTKFSFPQAITNITLTAKWVNEVTDEATLRAALNEGITTIKLMADINLSSALDLSNKNITIDLNGHVISGADISINTGNGKASLTLTDSRPNATHVDSTLPLGGVVTSKISMKQSGGGYNDCVLYANGGTVTSEFNTNTNAVAIKCTSNTPTVFTGKISGYTHLYGGIYYGTITSNVKIEAKKITFKNGNNTYAYEVVDTGNITVAPTTPPVKEGYNGFDGWYNGDTKYTFGSSLSEDITLTAKFKNPTTYTIGYVLNGGTVSPENPGDYTIESESITLNNPKKTGYTFIGWSGTNLSGNNNMTVTIPKGSTGARTYTANFSQNTYTVKFDTNGGSNISDKTSVKWDDKVLAGITNPTKAGYEFTGWKCSNKTVNANTKYSDLVANDTIKSVTLVAQWKDTEKPVITGLEKGKTYCDTVEFTVTDNDGIASVKANDVKLTATNGKYTLEKGMGTVKVVATDNSGNTADVTVTVNSGHTAGNDDGNCSTPVYCIYHPDTVVVKAKSHDFSGEWNKDEDGHWHICQNAGCTVPDTKVSHSGTDDGDCTTAVVCECGYVITAANANHTYGEWQSNGNNTHTRYCTVTGCNGYETESCSGGQATYFKKAVCKDCNEPYGNLLTDTTAPTGEITVGTNKWNSFLNTITFGIFFKNTQSVTITASDDSYSHDGYTDNKAVKVEYLLSDKGLSKTDLASETFTTYNGTFNINPDNKYVVYARLTDFAGNITYISSDGVVLDATAPVITGVTDSAVYYTTQKAVVTDDNLKSVTLDGVDVSGTTVTLDGNTDKDYTIIATDKSDNSTTVTVTMKSIRSLAESIDDVNGENVKSSDKKKIESVKESVGEVDISNAIDSEKEALNNINNKCEELLDIIDKVQKGIETDNIKNAESISPDNVTKGDRDTLEKAKTDLEKALEDYGSNYTDDEKAKIQSDLERVNKALKVLDDVKAVEDSITALPDTFEPDDLDIVQKIQDAKKSYDALTDYEKSLISKDTKTRLDTLIKGITAYIFYEGSGGAWTIGQGGTLTFTANGAYSKFTGIKVDGVIVGAENYTSKSGSTIITLNAEYLDALSVGTHTLTVLYTDGEAETKFEVKEEPEKTEDSEKTTNLQESANTEETTNPNKNTSKKSPQTGNDGETALWLAFLFFCGGSVIVTSAYRKKRKHS